MSAGNVRKGSPAYHAHAATRRLIAWRDLVGMIGGRLACRLCCSEHLSGGKGEYARPAYGKDHNQLQRAGVSRFGRAVEEDRRVRATDETIFTQGDRCESVLYIQTGGVKLSVLSKTGREAVVAMLGPGDFFGEGCLAGQTGPHRQRDGDHAVPRPGDREEPDGEGAARAACAVRPVHRAHAVAQRPDRRGPDRSALQLEREAAGARAAAAGALRQAGQAAAGGAEDLAGNARRRWSARRARA